MYQAELHGKLSSRIECREDVLTSNVFSFLKYANRTLFLKRYLEILNIHVSESDAKTAEFVFWPRFEEHTEPDLVIIVGDFYLLIEAKYFSDFDTGTQHIKAQLLREIECGLLEARNYGKEFRLIAITADSYFKDVKFKSIPVSCISQCIWTNWQKFASFLYDVLEFRQSLTDLEADFASDLYALLDRKNLRQFSGMKLPKQKNKLQAHHRIFFDKRTATFRGEFIGFAESLSSIPLIGRYGKSLFFYKGTELFASLRQHSSLVMTDSQLFWRL
jgi:hypothetical protein